MLATLAPCVYKAGIRTRTRAGAGPGTRAGTRPGTRPGTRAQIPPTLPVSDYPGFRLEGYPNTLTDFSEIIKLDELSAALVAAPEQVWACGLRYDQ